MNTKLPRGPKPENPEISGEVLESIQVVIAKGKTEARIALRYKIVLLLSNGERVTYVADKLDITRHTVIKWRDRFLEGGLKNLCDKPRSGRRPIFSPSSTS